MHSMGKIPLRSPARGTVRNARTSCRKRSISAGLSRPWDVPRSLQVGLGQAGCAALEMMPRPAARLRRCSRANIRPPASTGHRPSSGAYDELQVVEVDAAAAGR